MKLTLNKMSSSFRALAVAGATFGMIASASAYSTPPSWMPMTMLNVSFDTANQQLAVVDQASMMGAGVNSILWINTLAANGKPDTAATTPASFDPAQPWSVLNGTAFSRRLGWDDPNKNNADTSLRINNLIQSAYGSGASIWIDCLSKSAGLESYLAIGQYGVNADNTQTVNPALNAYSGIFGTAGSDTKWQWDGKMDHNAYAVSLADITEPNQLFSATYKVYVGDANGNEILNNNGSSASTIETWTWQVVPEPTVLSLALLSLGALATRKRLA